MLGLHALALPQTRTAHAGVLAQGTAAPQATTPSDSAPSDAASAAAAAPRVPDEAVAAIAEQLNCPTCQGYSLRDCPLTVCAQMREQIRMSLAEGLDDQAIIDDFVAYYGPQVLNAPPKDGFFLLAWWLPPFALAAGALGLVVWGYRQHRARRTERAGRSDAGLRSGRMEGTSAVRTVEATGGGQRDAQRDGNKPSGALHSGEDIDYEAAFDRLAKGGEEAEAP
jgi:cytochrome c-type biogenesis protein CcmH/NrfF